VLLVAAAASRCFVPELPFQGSALDALPGQAAAPQDRTGQTQPTMADNPLAYRADRSELARMTYAVLLLTAGAIWAIGGAVDGRIEVRHGRLAAAIGLLAVLTLASAMAAGNRRAAMDSWIEQLSLMAAAFLAVQLCADRRRFITLAVVLAAVGATVAARSYWRLAVEGPRDVAVFEAHRLEQLAQLGRDANTPEAQILEARLRDWSAKGFFSLANPFGSMLIVLGLAAAGLAIDKLRAAAAARRLAKLQGRTANESRAAKPGALSREVEPTAVAAGAAALAAGGILAVIPLTRSEGAMIAAVVAGAGLLAALIWREALARRWRACAAGAIAALVLAGAATAAYGLWYDRLPTKTMTFRWYYWTASAKILADRPLLGAGPGNFANAYLKYRRDQAEEDVKNPHNLLVHALTEYGVPGGVCYLALLGWLILLAVRPVREWAMAPPLSGGACPRFRPAKEEQKSSLSSFSLAAVVVAMLAARLGLWGATESAAIVLLHTIVPALVLAAMLAMLAWSGRDLAGLPDGAAADVARMALGAAAVGFLVHNIVEWSLWLPGAAGTFYLAVGAAAGRAGGLPAPIIRGRWAVAGAAVAGVLATVVIFWMPVAGKTYHTAGMLGALRQHDIVGALAEAEASAEADTLDPRPAADAAGVAMMAAGRARATGHGQTAGTAVGLALRFGYQALRRDVADPALYSLAGELEWAAQTFSDRRLRELAKEGDKAYQAGNVDKARRDWIAAAKLLPSMPADILGVGNFTRAVSLNPKSARLRIACANNYLNANLPSKALGQLAEALRLDKTLPADSAQRLRPVELRQIDTLGARAAALMGRRLAAPTTGPATTTREGYHRDMDPRPSRDARKSEKEKEAKPGLPGLINQSRSHTNKDSSS
jgi:O-antigen ligase